MKTKSEKNNVIECFEKNNKMKELIFFNISPSSLKSTKILKEKKESNQKMYELLGDKKAANNINAFWDMFIANRVKNTWHEEFSNSAKKATKTILNALGERKVF